MTEGITDCTKAYIAGVIDGEASVGYTSGKRPHIAIGHTCKDLLLFCQLHIGGIVRPNKGWPVCSLDCTKSHVHSRQQRLVWKATGTRAEIVLWNTLPYLITKKARALELLEVAVAKPDSKYTRTQVAKVLLDMEERGWNINDSLR